MQKSVFHGCLSVFCSATQIMLGNLQVISECFDDVGGGF